MVFPSVPLYLDAPNWQQQPNHHHGSSSDNPHLPPVVPTPVAPTGGAGSIRPGSMADRARMAKIPQPETALKCPRCDSTNTKFCYFNNYSLSQPRHFCKTCRRYWTRGGALRNVPVGGGCRRNKRSKSSSSKSPASSDRQSGASSTSALASNSCTSDIVVGHLPPQPPQLPNFMASLHHLAEYGAADIGLNFGGISPTVAVTPGGGSGPEMDFPIVGNSSCTSAMLSAGVGDQWRLPQVQQFPFMTSGLEPPPGLYPFEGEGVEPAYAGGTTQLRAKAPSASGFSHLGSIKMEENQGLNLSRQFMGLSGTDQFWGGGSAWTDLSGFSTPSTSHLF